MKVVLNLAIPPSARERYALYWAIPATLLGVTGLAFLLLFTVRSFRAYRAVQKSVAEQQGRENTLRAQEMALRKQLEEPEYRRLLDDVQFVNALIEKKRVSLPGLAADITDLMPDEVRLTGLALAPEGQELAVRFVITGKSEEAIERFLSDLEDSPHFKDVAIVNQGFEQTGAASELENIACTAHYLPGESEASGE
ncbi:MAG: PilN domain-containing protein [Terriglobia bacterium]|jgi:Tfp pilus assembly protein PilN